MEKEIKNILLANQYLTCCKLCGECSEKTELAKKFLNTKIESAIKSRKKKSTFKRLNYLITLIF